MHDDIEIHVKPSRLRTAIWSILMLAVIVGSGVLLWRAYQLKQAAITTKDKKSSDVVQKEEILRAEEGTESTQEGKQSAGLTDEENDEFVARVEHTVTFPQPPVDLNSSDSWLQEQLPKVNPHPKFKAWLEQTSDLMRKTVLLTDQVAQGKVPRKVFSFWAPEGPFKVKETDGRIVMDPEGYHRYDLLAEVVDAIDMQLIWRLYQIVRPLAQEAFAEISPAGTHFDKALLAAAEHLLRTPQPRGEITLVKPSVMYKFADPSLESLSLAQKQLLRMGPVNATIIKHKLGILRGYLLQEAKQPVQQPDMPLP